MTTYYAKPSSVYPAVTDDIGTPAEPYGSAETAGDFRTVFNYARANTAEAAEIILLDGAYDLEVLDIQYYMWNVAYDLTLSAASGASPYIDGKGTKAFLLFTGAADLYLDIIVKNCLSTSSDYTLKVNNASANVTIGANAQFLDCVAEANAAAIYVNNATSLTVEDGAVFSGNSASGASSRGGAIYLNYCSGTVTLSGLFEDNFSTLTGGAIHVSSNVTGDVTVEETAIFRENESNDGGDNGIGGAIFSSDFGGTFTCSGLFEKNIAWRSGGAIRCENTGTNTFFNLSVKENAVIGGNAETHQGGGICLTNTGVVGNFSDCTFRYNYCATELSAGGNLKLSNMASGIIKRCKFIGGSAGQGGGIDFGGGLSAVASVLEYCYFNNNHAYSNGGAWNALNQHAVTAYNNTYGDNTTDGDGCSVAGSWDSVNAVVRSLTNEIFLGKQVKELYNNGSTMNLDHCYFAGGESTAYGADSITNTIATIMSEGVNISGVHAESEAATDLNSNPVCFEPPDIGCYQRQTKVITEADYTPTLLEVRAGATVILKGGGDVDMSGLSESVGVIKAVLSGYIDSFTGLAGVVQYRWSAPSGFVPALKIGG